jgi:hypothetical protein
MRGQKEKITKDRRNRRRKPSSDREWLLVGEMVVGSKRLSRHAIGVLRRE